MASATTYFGVHVAATVRTICSLIAYSCSDWSRAQEDGRFQRRSSLSFIRNKVDKLLSRDQRFNSHKRLHTEEPQLIVLHVPGSLTAIVHQSPESGSFLVLPTSESGNMYKDGLNSYHYLVKPIVAFFAIHPVLTSPSTPHDTQNF